MSVQAGRIDDAVRHGPVLMKASDHARPRDWREDFATSVGTPILIAWSSRRSTRRRSAIRLNLCVAPRIDLLLIDREIAHEAIAPITQDRFQEADLECVAQIDNTKPPCRVTLAGITEPARRLSIS